MISTITSPIIVNSNATARLIIPALAIPGVVHQLASLSLPIPLLTGGPPPLVYSYAYLEASCLTRQASKQVGLNHTRAHARVHTQPLRLRGPSNSIHHMAPR